MTKQQERLLARQLRRDEGLAIKAIARRLGVARSSVSVWVRDIELRPDQRQALQRYDPQLRGSAAVAARYRTLQRDYQAAGRTRARAGDDPLHLAGCMLYWAEGAKARNSLRFGNSDPDMMRLFMRFLREGCAVVDSQITVYITCYVGDSLSQEAIETFWLGILGLDRSSLRKTAVNRQPSSSKQAGRKLPHGVCAVHISSTELVQNVYGAIQEYAGIDKPEWLD
jgi:transposase-like protein